MDIIKDRDTGRMKGFAFVTMNSDEEAQKAITMLNEKTLDDRAIKVNIAKPRVERDRGSSFSNQALTSPLQPPEPSSPGGLYF